MTRAERNERYGKAKETPEEPVVSEEAAHLVTWFQELSTTRATGFSGPESLRPSDVLAWSVLFGVSVTPLEARALFSMDAAYMAAMSKAREEYSSSNDKKPEHGKGKTYK